MNSNRLRRTYLLRGLDQILYSSQPAWQEGTFEQAVDVEDEGRLVLLKDGISSASDLNAAIRQMDQQAERFRLAVSWRTVSPLTLKLEGSEEPCFDPLGVASATSTLMMGDKAQGAVLPRDPPVEMEQLPEAASRWVMTLAETKTFRGHPDECLKRLHLLIEELSKTHGACLSEKQRELLPEIWWMRHFVSHADCWDPKLCEFIARHLPSAVISEDPLVVRFDRTQVEHTNFVARYATKAREVQIPLLKAAIETLEP